MAVPSLTTSRQLQGIGLAAPGPRIFPAKPDQEGFHPPDEVEERGLKIRRKRYFSSRLTLTLRRGGAAASLGKHYS
jgi:hypothetical protein